MREQPPFDFFKIAPFSQTFMTERAASFIHAEGIKGLSFCSAEESLNHDVEIEKVTMGLPPLGMSAKARADLWQQIVRLDRDNLLEKDRRHGLRSNPMRVELFWMINCLSRNVSIKNLTAAAAAGIK